MEQIKQIIKENDIGAHVVLHLPGDCETYSKMDPTYSCCFKQHTPEGQMLRIRSKLVDYGGDQEAQKKQLSETLNMLQFLAVKTGEFSVSIMNLIDIIDTKHMEIATTEGTESTHEQQNN